MLFPWVPSFRRLASARRVCLCTALAVLAVAGVPVGARTVRHAKHSHPRTAKRELPESAAPVVKRTRLSTPRHVLPEIPLPEEGVIAIDQPEEGEKYELKLARQNGENLDVIYRVGDTYLPDALDNLSLFLRDSHNEEVKSYDPRIFDLLHTMLRMVDHSSSEIQILCGYRSQETNDALRAKHTTNAAKHSQHIEATALDLRVPGVSATELRDAALALGAGGVGYYPKGQFIHVDTGQVRKWVFVRRRATRGHKHHRRV